jgi:lysophospholipase L1-like esterase
MAKNWRYAIIVVLAVFLLLEGGARLLEWKFLSTTSSESDRSGWQTEFFGSLFDWHEPDPELLWRFRAGLDNLLIKTNSHHFLGPEISGRKPANTFRVLILGDSSPVGLGLKSRRQTFGEILRYLLDDYFLSRKKVEIINAAVSGYSSEQVRRLLESRGWDYDPDLVILYCGNNDASISGPSADRELLAGQKFKSLRSLCCHLALYRVMRAFIQPLISGMVCDPHELKMRVSPRQYGENLRRIISQCQDHRCPLIILQPPVPYLWPAGLQFRPFLHVTGADGQVIMPPAMAGLLGRDIAYCLDEERLREIYGKFDIFTREVYQRVFKDSLPAPEAIEYYLTLLASDQQDPTSFNNLGVSYWRNRQYASADSSFRKAISLFRLRHSDSLDAGRFPAIAAALSPFLYNLGINSLSMGEDHGYLDSALQADYFSLRIKRPYWHEIENVNETSGVVVIDLPRIFDENGGEYLFIDHCHPTPEGHLLIAQAIYDVIRNHRWM